MHGSYIKYKYFFLFHNVVRIGLFKVKLCLSFIKKTIYTYNIKYMNYKIASYVESKDICLKI